MDHRVMMPNWPRDPLRRPPGRPPQKRSIDALRKAVKLARQQQRRRRAEAEAQAKENRIRFGLGKEERSKELRERERADKEIEDKRLD
jgi:hypothetical protein